MLYSFVIVVLFCVVLCRAVLYHAALCCFVLRVVVLLCGVV